MAGQQRSPCTGCCGREARPSQDDKMRYRSALARIIHVAMTAQLSVPRNDKPASSSPPRTASSTCSAGPSSSTTTSRCACRARQRHFLINPFGLHYSEVTASNLVKIDLAGNIVGESKWPINPAGFTPHATIHAHIPEAHCVMHTHTTAGLAVACLEDGLSHEQLLLGAAARQARVSRLRRHHRARRRRTAAAREHRRPAGRDPAQPRPPRVG